VAQRRPIEVMLELLHAQRAEVARRETLVRDTPEWQAATERLDDLNERIMQVADIDAERRELLENGIQVALDSRPIDDVPFRREVIDSLRQALCLVNLGTLTSRSAGRVAGVEERVRATNLLVEGARSALRTRYPDATLDDAGERGALIDDDGLLLTLRADREGQVA
jgi:hypothetical protein